MTGGGGGGGGGGSIEVGPVHVYNHHCAKYIARYSVTQSSSLSKM